MASRIRPPRMYDRSSFTRAASDAERAAVLEVAGDVGIRVALLMGRSFRLMRRHDSQRSPGSPGRGRSAGVGGRVRRVRRFLSGRPGSLVAQTTSDAATIFLK